MITRIAALVLGVITAWAVWQFGGTPHMLHVLNATPGHTVLVEALLLVTICLFTLFRMGKFSMPSHCRALC